MKVGENRASRVLAIDVGGTFVDLALVENGKEILIHKALTDPANPAAAVIRGIEALAREQGLSADQLLNSVARVIHGTTLTTNAVIVRSGARTGLITTKGLRDELEMRRGLKEDPWDLKLRPPEPLVPRFLRLGVEEQVDFQGRELQAVNAEDVVDAIRLYEREGVRSVAICLKHAYANTSHEKQIADEIRKQQPSWEISASSDILPRLGFYERVSTTVFNAYTKPILARYLQWLLEELLRRGFRKEFLVMVSSGGVSSVEAAIERAAQTIGSGPSAGPVAGAMFAAPHEYGEVVVVDMGGTSFDVSLVREGSAFVSTDNVVEGYALAFPMLAVRSIGAGGGSIAHIDASGLLRVGPQSAGADPGPACYGRGGTEATVADASLALGYLDPRNFLGGRMVLDKNAAVKAIKVNVADPLSIAVEEAALGIYKVVNTNMAAGVRAVTIEKGLDPRQMSLVVAGGAGPLHAAAIAEELEIPVIIVPRVSSVFCAVGMLHSDLRHDFVRTYYALFSELDWKRLYELCADMMNEGDGLLEGEGVPEERREHRIALEMRYWRQFREIAVPVSLGEIQTASADTIIRRFHQAHDELYGFSMPHHPTELVNSRLTSLGQTDKPELPKMSPNGSDSSHALRGSRVVFLSSEVGYATVPVFDGLGLQHGNAFEGPAIVDLPTTTVLVPSSFGCACDLHGSYVLTRTSIDEKNRGNRS